MSTRTGTINDFIGTSTTLACQMVGGCSVRTLVSATFIVALLAASGLFCVWSRTEVVRLGYAGSELAREVRDLAAQKERLRAQAALLRSPDRIETIARDDLGMQFPSRGQIRNVEYGRRPAHEVGALAFRRAGERSEN